MKFLPEEYLFCFVFVFVDRGYAHVCLTFCPLLHLCCSLRCGEVFCGKFCQYGHHLSLLATPELNGISYRVSKMSTVLKRSLKCPYGQHGFCCFGISIMCKKVF